MINEGASAPSFTLPGLRDGEQTEYSLDETTANDRAALLVFYPFDFSPVCTNELCAIRDAEWFQLTPALDVWAISGDSVYAHRAFAEEYGLNFPYLVIAPGGLPSYMMSVMTNGRTTSASRSVPCSLSIPSKRFDTHGRQKMHLRSRISSRSKTLLIRWKRNVMNSVLRMSN